MRLLLATLAVCMAAGPDAARISGRLTGSTIEHSVVKGESLLALAARYGVDQAAIARRNGLDLRKPIRAGTAVTIDARHIAPVDRGAPLLINIPQRMLFAFGEDGSVVSFPIAAGRPDWPTPLGRFQVVVTEEHPTWNVPVSIQEEMRREGREVITEVPPCAENPLGDYWIGLSLPGIGVHGTNAPASIYRFTTHGCIRLSPESIDALFARMKAGMTGDIIYEPALVADVDGRLFVEVHRDVYRKRIDAFETIRRIAIEAGLAPRIDWHRLRRAAALAEGIATDVTFDPGT